jgi:SAM-dependent MidA family methyltransferase
VAVEEVPAGEPAEHAVPWSVAWERAAFGPLGFYSHGAGARLGPARFFRTSVHVGAVFHRAIARLLLEVDARLGSPARLDLVDVGAGRGELLVGVLDALPHDVATRVRAVAVDVAPPTPDLDGRIVWITGRAPGAVPHGLRGLVIAHEWLDDIPLDVVEVDDHGIERLVLVERDGTEHLGATLDDDAAWAAWGLSAGRAREWLGRWGARPHDVEAGARRELGMARDDAWRDVVTRLDAGTALAIDYGYTGVPGATLTGYHLRGNEVRPVPDGTVNLTAHVAVDTLAAAAGVPGSGISLQCESLAALEVSATVPPRELATINPAAYADALETASAAAELVALSGLGGFHWIRLDR